MRSAALPGRPGHGGADRGHQPWVGVAGDQRDPGQAPGDQVTKERQPARPILGRGHGHAQDFSVALGVDPRGDQGVHPDDAAVLAHLEHQGVGGDERVRAGVEGSGAKRLDLLIEVLDHLRYLGLGKACHTEGFDEALNAPRRHAQQIAGRHHTSQRPLGALTAGQQPVQEIALRAGLQNSH